MKPDPKAFKTYEDYNEALICFYIDASEARIKEYVARLLIHEKPDAVTGTFQGKGAITQEYLDDVACIKKKEIDKKQAASKGQIDERPATP